MVDSRQEWQQARQAAGGTKGMVRGVSVGDLIEKFHRAAGSVPKDLMSYWKNVEKTALDLHKGLQKYKADPKVAENAKLVAVVDRMLRAVEGYVTSARKWKDPVRAVDRSLEQLVVQAQRVEANASAEEYAALYKSATVGMKKPLEAIAKQFNEARPAVLSWQKTVDRTWSLDGAHLKGWKSNPQAVKAAAKHIRGSAEYLRTKTREAVIGQSEL